METKADNLLIKVSDNPTQGACDITTHFVEEFGTNLPIIDNIETEIVENAPSDKIEVIEKDIQETVFLITGQRALMLNTVANFLIDYLEIKISK